MGGSLLCAQSAMAEALRTTSTEALGSLRSGLTNVLASVGLGGAAEAEEGAMPEEILPAASARRHAADERALQVHTGRLRRGDGRLEHREESEHHGGVDGWGVG